MTRITRVLAHGVVAIPGFDDLSSLRKVTTCVLRRWINSQVDGGDGVWLLFWRQTCRAVCVYVVACRRRSCSLRLHCDLPRWHVVVVLHVGNNQFVVVVVTVVIWRQPHSLARRSHRIDYCTASEHIQLWRYLPSVYVWNFSTKSPRKC